MSKRDEACDALTGWMHSHCTAGHAVDALIAAAVEAVRNDVFRIAEASRNEVGDLPGSVRLSPAKVEGITSANCEEIGRLQAEADRLRAELAEFRRQNVIAVEEAERCGYERGVRAAATALRRAHWASAADAVLDQMLSPSAPQPAETPKGPFCPHCGSDHLTCRHCGRTWLPDDEKPLEDAGEVESGWVPLSVGVAEKCGTTCHYAAEWKRQRTHGPLQEYRCSAHVPRKGKSGGA